MTLDAILPLFMSLGGVASLVTALVNALKKINVVKDGQAPAYSLIFNLVGLVAVVLLRVFSPDFDFTSADGAAGSISQILTLILGLAGQLLVSRGVHEGIKGTPVIGTSNAVDKP